MKKTIEAKEQLLADVLLSDSGYNIPWYQRPYAWEEQQVTELFDDLYRSYEARTDEGYFLGSIVLTEEEDNREKDVIDGQQRLTTLTMLFSCLAYHSKKNGGTDKYEELLKKYIINPGDETQDVQSKPRLNIRERDRLFFEKHIHKLDYDTWLEEYSKQSEKPKKKSKKDKPDPKELIRNNSIILLNRIKKHFDSIERLKEFVTFLTTGCSLVIISTQNRQTASRVFSVMNSRGLDLQPTDIIKADVMGAESSNNSLNTIWEEMEDKLGREDFNSLFYYVRMIRVKKKLEESILKEFNKHFYNDMNNPSKLIKEILEPHCDALSMIQKREYKTESEDAAEAVNNYLDWLDMINNSDWIPPAIQFLAENKDAPDYVLYFFKKLERLSAYLYIYSKSDNKRIERYAELIRELEENAGEKNPLQALELTVEEKNEMITTLSGDIYNLTAQKRNYILLRLDNFMSDGGAIYRTKTLTTEHVLPQSPKDGSEWSKNWTEEQRNEWLHKLANLILLSRRKNSQAQNYDFDEKKSIYFKGKKGLPPYPLTSDACQESKWTPTVVKKRQGELLDVLKENWELD